MLKGFLIRKFKFLLLKKRWRWKNKHNRTSILNSFETHKVTVGNHTYGNLYVETYQNPDEKLEIGHFCSIASGVKFILGGNHPYKGFSTYPFEAYFFNNWGEAKSNGPIRIEDDVWIGCNALILSGVTIGQGAIIAAGSVVTKDIPPYAIAAGCPARVIKYRFEEKEIISKLLSIDFSKIKDEDILNNRNGLYCYLHNSTDIPTFLE